MSTIISQVKLPQYGICAHRGARSTFPENTIPAFKEAIRLGAQMIEFDVWLSKDSKLIVMHDPSVNRTTNGSGLINQLTLKQLKALDAGLWKDTLFTGISVPTFEEVIEIMPDNIWLNIHIKKDKEAARKVAEIISRRKIVNQSVLALKKSMFGIVKNINDKIKICNMDRGSSTEQYVNETINLGCSFIQLTNRADSNIILYTSRLRENGVRINYYGTNSVKKMVELFDSGVNFVLVDEVGKLLKRAKEIGVISPKRN